MELSLVTEKRQHRRYPFDASSPPRGVMVNCSTQERIPFNIIDISKGGMGIWAPCNIVVGDVYQITFADNNYSTEATARWCSEISENYGFRAGFQGQED